MFIHAIKRIVHTVDLSFPLPLQITAQVTLTVAFKNRTRMTSQAAREWVYGQIEETRASTSILFVANTPPPPLVTLAMVAAPAWSD